MLLSLLLACQYPKIECGSGEFSEFSCSANVNDDDGDSGGETGGNSDASTFQHICGSGGEEETYMVDFPPVIDTSSKPPEVTILYENNLEYIESWNSIYGTSQYSMGESSVGHDYVLDEGGRIMVFCTWVDLSTVAEDGFIGFGLYRATVWID